jgi:hypothetical protein
MTTMPDRRRRYSSPTGLDLLLLGARDSILVVTRVMIGVSDYVAIDHNTMHVCRIMQPVGQN